MRSSVGIYRRVYIIISLLYTNALCIKSLETKSSIVFSHDALLNNYDMVPVMTSDVSFVQHQLWFTKDYFP